MYGAKRKHEGINYARRGEWRSVRQGKSTLAMASALQRKHQNGGNNGVSHDNNNGIKRISNGIINGVAARWWRSDGGAP